MNRIDEGSALKLFAQAEGINIRNNDADETSFLKSRISRLGVDLFKGVPNNPTSMTELNPLVMKTATEMHQHRFRSYTKEEAIVAVKFLELMILYGYYENLALNLTPLKEGSTDPLVEKSLKSAQKIWNHLDTKKITKEAMIDELELLTKRTKKVLGDRLQPSEQMFFRKYMDKALTILCAFAKQGK